MSDGGNYELKKKKCMQKRINGRFYMITCVWYEIVGFKEHICMKNKRKILYDKMF